MCTNYVEIKLVGAVWRLDKKKLKICRQVPKVVLMTAKQVISRRLYNENDCEISLA